MKYSNMADFMVLNTPPSFWVRLYLCGDQVEFHIGDLSTYDF